MKSNRCKHLETLEQLVGKANGPDVVADSRKVKKNDCFVALRGTQSDGHAFCSDAIKKGAAFLITEEPVEASEKCKNIVVENTAEALGLLAQARYGFPAKKLTNLGVTGTNGKTTVSYLVQNVLRFAGRECGMMGTIVCDTCEAVEDSALTTPDALFTARKQKQMLDAGATHMMMEVSSHALVQNRVAGIDFHAAAFTNLTGDHLDYHGDEASYLQAKSRLFETLSEQSSAILNRQSPHARKIATNTNANIMWYAIEEPADLTAYIQSMDIHGTTFVLGYRGESYRVVSPLIGTYNVSNHLAAAGLCLAAGVDLHTIARGLSRFSCVPGRLERVETDAPCSIFIDYAHTDDALQNVLVSVRQLRTNRLIVLFGCGGDRDHSKRPRMASVAEKLADVVIVTSDNPRNEHPKKIIGEIVAGFANTDTDRIIVEPDRKAAIETALEKAQPDDIIVIAGKGHETYQIIGETKHDFNDREVIQELTGTKQWKTSQSIL